MKLHNKLDLLSHRSYNMQKKTIYFYLIISNKKIKNVLFIKYSVLFLTSLKYKLIYSICIYLLKNTIYNIFLIRKLLKLHFLFE